MSVLASSFSYAQLEPEAERVARASATAIKSVTAHAIPEIGRHLLEAKAALPHGAFTAWTEVELGIGARSARNYMSAAQWLEGKPATVSVLPPTIIYALAGPAASAEVVSDVVDLAKAGPIDVAAVRAKLDAARVDQMDLRHAQRRSPKLTMAEMRARREKDRKEARRQQVQHLQREQDEQKALRVSLQPLADRLAGLGPEIVDALFAATDGYLSRSVVRELTYELLRNVHP